MGDDVRLDEARMTPEEQQELISRVGRACERSLMSVDMVCRMVEFLGAYFNDGVTVEKLIAHFLQEDIRNGNYQRTRNKLDHMLLDDPNTHFLDVNPVTGEIKVIAFPPEVLAEGH